MFKFLKLKKTVEILAYLLDLFTLDIETTICRERGLGKSTFKKGTQMIVLNFFMSTIYSFVWFIAQRILYVKINPKLIGISGKQTYSWYIRNEMMKDHQPTWWTFLPWIKMSSLVCFSFGFQMWRFWTSRCFSHLMFCQNCKAFGSVSTIIW